MGEFNDLYAGYIQRDNNEWRRTAQLAAWIISSQRKRPISADKLLKKPKDEERKGKAKEKASRAMLQELVEELG